MTTPAAQPALPFAGKAYSPERDARRLGEQLRALVAVMADYQWHNPEDLEGRTGYRWASLSARWRDLKKPAFHEAVKSYLGADYGWEAECIAGGSWRYRAGRSTSNEGR